MDNTSHTPYGVWGVAILTLIIGAALGYYYGLDVGYKKAVADAARSAAQIETSTNPLEGVKTNPLEGVKTNPFE